MGIGRAIGLALAREGATVIGVACGQLDLESFLEEARKLQPGSSSVVADVSDRYAVARLFEAVYDR